MAVSLPEIALPGEGEPGVVGLVFPEARRGQRLRENLELYLPLVGLVLMALACFLGPLVLPIPGPNGGSIVYANLPPFSPGHILGTDPLGNDLLSRVLYGGRVSFEVGLGAQGIGLVLGSFLGMLAGLKGGITETVIMRIMDMLLAFPGLIIAITITTYLGPSEVHVIWAISFFTVPGMARLTRAHTLRFRDREFVVSAYLCGRSDRQVLLRHLVPNVIPNVLTFVSLGIGIAIVVEAGLSFLGFGVPPPAPSWGNMISQGQSYIAVEPYLVLVPGGFLFFTVMCLNLFADALRARISGV
jgi:peptide/nickel transport system permease protein